MEDAKEVPANGEPVKMSSWKKNKKPVKPEDKILRSIHIDLYESGRVSVQGPLSEPVNFHGMLAVATKIVNDAATAQLQQAHDTQSAAEQVKGSMPWWRKVFRRRPTVVQT